MNPLFLKRTPTARQAAARKWIWRGMLLLILLAICGQSSAAGERALQTAVYLAPRQIEPADKAFVSTPGVAFHWAPTYGAPVHHLIIYREDRLYDPIRVDVLGDVSRITYTGLQPGYSYRWQVEVDFDTNGYNSDFFEFTLAPQPIPPMTPSNFQASKGGMDEAVWLEWESTFRTAYYLLQRREPGNARFISYARVGPQPNSYRDWQLELGKHYEYQVLACNAAGCSQPSPVDEGWAGTGECVVLPVPGLSTPPNGSVVHFTPENSIYYLHWQEVSGAEGYLVRLWDANSQELLIEDHSNDTQQTVYGEQGLLAWNVVAVTPGEGCPDSPPSETWTFTGVQDPSPLEVGNPVYLPSVQR